MTGGKARGNSDTNDLIKASLDGNRDSYGTQRTNYQGTGQERGSTNGVGNVDQDVRFKLDTRGGIMKGALGRKGIATAELEADGIIDMTIYHIPRLYITNTAGNTLKVIIPSMGDGQEVWIRSNGGGVTPIQHTAGTGDETTGNMDTMASTTYTMTGADWIGWHYDFSDLKWHQITAGNQNIGGSAGEVFTWTNNHASGGFNLEMGSGDVLFGVGGTTSLQGTDSLFLASVNSTEFMRATAGLVEFTGIIRPDGNGTRTLGTASRFWSTFYTVDLQMAGTLSMNNNIVAGVSDLLYDGGNSIVEDTSGDMKYSLGSSFDKHQFFVGSERFRIDDSHIVCFQPLLTTTITGSGSNLNDSITITPSTGFVYSATVSHSFLSLATGFSDLLINGGGVLIAGGSESFGFCDATPVTRPHTYIVTGAVVDTTLSQSTTSVTEVAEVLGTLIRDLQTHGIVK